MQQTRPPPESAQVIPIAVLDTRSWMGRGLYYDALALAVNLLAGTAAALDIYAAGYVRALGGAALTASFGALARIGVELLVFLASFLWMAGRLIRAAYRDLPRA